jgi:hypothetical protein
MTVDRSRQKPGIDFSCRAQGAQANMLLFQLRRSHAFLLGSTISRVGFGVSPQRTFPAELWPMSVKSAPSKKFAKIQTAVIDPGLQ